MLEHVSLGQARFMTPGIAPDPRGVVLGRYGLLVFPTIEGVVSWLRLYSAEATIDELLPSLAIHSARTPLRSQEFLLRIPATSSYAMDRAARCARLVGGATFTGSSKHFVKYRDDRSPYGYDAVDIQGLPSGADVMIHSDDFTQTYGYESAIAFDSMLFRLSLRRIPAGCRLRGDEREELMLAVERGLADGIIRYLWRNRVDAEVGMVSTRGRSAFADATAGRPFLIARVRQLPQRILDLFWATPGIDVFRPAAGNVAIEVGFRHVIDLSSCASVFDSESYYLFWGSDRVDVLAGPLQLSSIEHFTHLEIDLERAEASDAREVTAHDPVGVNVRLAPSLAPSRHVIGALVPSSQAAWVKKLVYALPQTTLAGHRVAVTDRGIVLIASLQIDVIPIGQLLSELAPGLLVPLGMDLVPRVAPEVLARTLGHGAGLLTIFTHDGKPFQISESAFVPLERRSLAKIEVARVTVIDTRIDATGEPSLVNEAVGRFALWGYPSLAQADSHLRTRARIGLGAPAKPAPPPEADEPDGAGSGSGSATGGAP
jgi:hypothetical protein